MPLLISVLIFCFLALAVIHFNWAIGGQWGKESAIPTTASGKAVLHPKWYDSLIIGLLLLSFSLFYLNILTDYYINISTAIINVIKWIIPSLFLLRSIGDFKYVGLFKKIIGTYFAKADNKLFIPLCLLISTIGYIIALT